MTDISVIDRSASNALFQFRVLLQWSSVVAVCTGGCCNHCGSVEHFKRECPELQKKKGHLLLFLLHINSCKCCEFCGFYVLFNHYVGYLIA